MLRALERPFEIAGAVVFISASAGIALAPADGADVEELIANVDMALYKAKANGRGNSVFFHNALRADMHARRELELRLRQAYAQGELELYFQPQVRLADAAVVGSEALEVESRPHHRGPRRIHRDVCRQSDRHRSRQLDSPHGVRNRGLLAKHGPGADSRGRKPVPELIP
jgi:predicted signal transduction protein with EAL and GGDEF domain